MTLAPEYLAAATAGLLGSGHCVGMCGPLLLASQLSRRGLAYVLAANLGRILSYVVAGMLVSTVAQQTATITPLHPTHPAWRGMLGLIIVLSAIQIGGWWRGSHALERWMAPLWARLAQRLKTVFPPQRPRHALLFGILWGWLPCGLVYSMLLWALAQPSPLAGGALMAVFGLATVPSLLAVSWFGEMVRQQAAQRWSRHLAAMTLIALGIWTAWPALGSVVLALGRQL